MKWFRTRSYRAIGYVWLFVCFWPPSPKPEWNIAWEWEIGNQNLPIGCFFFFVWPCRTGRSWPVQSPCPSLSSLRPFFFSIYIRKIRYLLRQRNKIHFQMFDLDWHFRGLHLHASVSHDVPTGNCKNNKQHQHIQKKNRLHFSFSGNGGRAFVTNPYDGTTPTAVG